MKTRLQLGLPIVLVAVSCAGGRGPSFAAFAISGREQSSHCFVEDAQAAVDALETSSTTLFTAADSSTLESSMGAVSVPLFAYYAGHGELGTHGETIGASSWVFDSTAAAPRVRIGDLLEKVKAPWVVMLSASCYSAWTDVSRARVPASLISTSKRETYEEPVGARSACSRPSALGELIATGLEGAADTNQDCLVTDEELAEFVNRGTSRWPRKTRPDLRVSRNRSAQLPVARVSSFACERNVARLRELADVLGGELGTALREHARLAEGTSLTLPKSEARYYVTAAESHQELQRAARRRGLARFPGGIAAARTAAVLAPFTEIVELEVTAEALLVRNLATGSERRIPISAGGLEDVLPGCGSVEALRGRRVYLRFDGAIPAGEVSVRAFRFRPTGAAIPCTTRLSGNCLEVTLSFDAIVYPGDPVHCSEGTP